VTLPEPRDRRVIGALVCRDALGTGETWHLEADGARPRPARRELALRPNGALGAVATGTGGSIPVWLTPLPPSSGGKRRSRWTRSRGRAEWSLARRRRLSLPGARSILSRAQRDTGETSPLRWTGTLEARCSACTEAGASLGRCPVWTTAGQRARGFPRASESTVRPGPPPARHDRSRPRDSQARGLQLRTLARRQRIGTRPGAAREGRWPAGRYRRPRRMLCAASRAVEDVGVDPAQLRRTLDVVLASGPEDVAAQTHGDSDSDSTLAPARPAGERGRWATKRCDRRASNGTSLTTKGRDRAPVLPAPGARDAGTLHAFPLFHVQRCRPTTPR